MSKPFKIIDMKTLKLKKKSPAKHKLGDIGHSEYDELINVDKETEDSFIGMFEEGYGFFGVEFMKSDVRPMTKEEVHKYNGQWYVLNGMPLYQVFVDYEGHTITKEEWEVIKDG